ncbi:hypothetical protein [Streptomyces beihaiensis]|uniref:Uncharacterized protein n=1 Tax=Streptomyces beihaiensis TaxID=2984495 RepID=A0ABT3U0T7_9ACTN|nr:hypothetical protein [Streptomyces beihaiensis]MCX3061870.1 hypothetical protein [Streptomyces beihaiensis]
MMPQLPEDIIDRLVEMERRIEQLSTAVHTRPALDRITSGTVEITDGGSLVVRTPDDEYTVLQIGSWSGSEYGFSLSRQTGQAAITAFNGDGSSTSLQPVRIYDVHGLEIFSDDIVTGGLARPWLSMLAPQDTNVARWPQTTATSWTTVARSFNPKWQPKMRLYLYTAASSGATGEVRVLLDGAQWGTTVSAGSTFDHTDLVSSDFVNAFGALMKVEIQARVTSTSGTVYAQPMMMFGTQS